MGGETSRIGRASTGFYALWIGQAVSVLGSSSASFALALQILEQTSSALLLSAVVALSSLASIYLAPVIGSISDAYPRKPVAVLSNVGMAACALALAALSGAAQLWFPAVLALVFASSVCSTMLSLTLVASVRQMRVEADLTRANGVTSLLESGPVVVAPLIGSLLYSVAEPYLVFVFDAITSVVAAFIAARVAWGERARPGRSGGLLKSGASSGLAYLWRRPVLRRLQFSFAWINFFNGFGIAAVAAFVVAASEEAGDAASWNLAAVNTAAAVGMLIGAGLVAFAGPRLSRVAAILGGVLMAALLGRLLLVFTSLVVVWVLAMLVRSVAVQLQNGPLTALWQEQVPPEVQGSVFGARRLTGQGLYPVAILAGGAAAHALGAAGLSPLTAAAVIVGLAAVCEAFATVPMATSRPLLRLLRGDRDRPSSESTT